jgi:hypothetical protein
MVQLLIDAVIQLVDGFGILLIGAENFYQSYVRR